MLHNKLEHRVNIDPVYLRFLLFYFIYWYLFFLFCAPNGLSEMFGIAYQSKTWKSTGSIFNMVIIYIILLWNNIPY